MTEFSVLSNKGPTLLLVASIYGCTKLNGDFAERLKGIVLLLQKGDRIGEWPQQLINAQHTHENICVAPMLCNLITTFMEFNNTYLTKYLTKVTGEV